MERFLAQPNLPKGRVTAAVLSGEALTLRTRLEQYGVRCVTAAPWPALPAPVASHPDMLCHHLGGRKILVNQGNQELSRFLLAEGMAPVFSQAALGGTYPADIPLNAARIGRFLLGHAACDSLLRQACAEKNVCFIPVKQGYAKCSTVVVTENACITADPSVKAAAVAAGLDVLAVRPGFVALKGYSYGFLGGACGKLSKDCLAFFGDGTSHPDWEAICSFLRNYHIHPLSLQSGELQDTGGLISLKEVLSEDAGKDGDAG